MCGRGGGKGEEREEREEKKGGKEEERQKGRERGKRTDWKQGWEKTRGREDRVEERSRGTQESGISELEEELKKQTGTWGIVSETGEGNLVF